MKQILISYENGYTFLVDTIKYFKHNHNSYLIYTFHEEDEKGYIKLYIVKIMEQFGEKVSQTIRRMDEWNKMRHVIKKLIFEIRSNNIESFAIMDASLLNELTIYNAREFRLAKNLVNILSTNVEFENIGDAADFTEKETEQEKELLILEELSSPFEEEEIEDMEVLEL